MKTIKSLLFISLITLQICAGQTLKKEEIEQLKFRHIGPVGNRVSAAIGISGNDQIYFAGAASGGLWKTSDAGITWRPVFDDKNVASVCALAAAPSDPLVIFAGTGESFIRSNVTLGNGVYKSTDGGETWQLSGLENSGRVARIAIHPTNPDIVFVSAMGHAYAPQKDRGVYKTTDGGKTWKQVLYVDDNTGSSDVIIDPSNPRIMFAGMWQLALKNWNRTSGGPGSGLYMSSDGGETWKKLTGSGLPEGPIGKVIFAMTPAAPNRVYVTIETGDGLEKLAEKDKVETGELWRSDDKGKTWALINSDRNITGRQAYYSRVQASPDNPNEVHFINGGFFTSIDGGRTLEVTSFLQQPYGDHHDMWIDPKNPNRSIVSHDGGVSISENRGKSWNRIQFPIAQLYHVTVDNNIPYNVLTNKQDGPSMRGPSRSGGYSFFGLSGIPSISPGMWHEVGGGESGFATPDPVDPNIIWSTASGTGAVGGVVVRFNEKNRQFRQVEIWPEYVAGSIAANVKYRFQWTFPLLISKHDHNTVYAASQMVHKTTNGGQSWQVISPDLTLNDKKQQQQSGGLTPDNIGVEYGNVISSFEESPLKQGVLWAGSSDGQISLSQDGGKAWTNVTKNLLDLPAQGAVRNIEASKWSEGKAFLVVDFHEQGNFQPFAYRTTDFGKTWKKIVKGIEGGNLNYCRSIKEDPIRKGLLYLGTETTLYVSFDDGENWQTFMGNLPHTPYYWIEVQEHFNDLVLGTYGRGVWILDDLTPLQQMPANAAETKAALFNPKDAYRFQPRTSTLEPLPNATWGTDPPYGASINYWTNSDKDSVKLYITGTAGDTLRTFKLKGKKGINRVWWDLEIKPTKDMFMRTLPVGADWVSLDKERKRPAHISANFKSYSVAPGKYNVLMATGGQKFSSTVNILKDPHSDGSLEDIKAQNDFLASIYKDFNTMADMVNDMEWIRRQVYDVREVLKPKSANKKLVAAAGKLDSALMKVEGKLVQLKYTGTGQDDVRYPEMLAGKLGYVAGAVATADFAPADQHKEVYAMLKEQLTQVQGEMDAVIKGDLAAFMKQLDEAGVKNIIVSWKK